MNPIIITKYKINSILLFILLAVLALLSKIITIDVIFEFKLLLCSIFLLIILKLFGIKRAILTAFIINALDFAYINQGFEPLLSFAEICFVGLAYNKRRKNMILWDAVYWATLGSFIILLVFYRNTGAFGIECYSNILFRILNGLLNTTLAEGIVTYTPIKNYCYEENDCGEYPTIVNFLIHTSIAVIFAPFVFYITISCWNYENTIIKDAHSKINSSTESVVKQVSSTWPSDYINALKLKSVIHLGYIEEILVNTTKNSTIQIDVLDDNYNILASNHATSSKQYDLLKNGKISSAYGNMNIFIPKSDNTLMPGSQWNIAHYSVETEFYNMKLLVQIPLSQYRKELFNTLMLQTKTLIFSSLLTIIFIFFVNKIVLSFLTKLLMVSTGLPEKLKLQENVSWPTSNILELNNLTSNFKVMSEDLKNLISMYQNMYHKLEQKTNMLVESEQKLHNLAYYDTLTGLPNRFYFNNYLKDVLETSRQSYNNTSIAVMLLDLDRFKHVNDTLGHLAGDLLLKVVAERLNCVLECCRKNFEFFVARQGGDEFVIVLNGVEKNDPQIVAQSIIDSLTKPVNLEENEVFIGASIGISIYPYDGTNIVELVKNADVSMYTAKEMGGNRYQIYSPTNNKTPQKMLLENNMYRALEKKEFIMYYQPKINSFTETITGLEALIRWYHGDEFIMPDQFIPLAEETGLIIPIGEWALYEACSQTKKWHDSGYPDLNISVNCSTLQFEQDDMVSLVKRVLDETKLSPQHLELEITENLFIKNVEHVKSELLKLKELGVKISIDDFGKGYSSFSVLKGLPVSSLKIDKSFIRDITHDRNSLAVVKAIIELAHNMDLKVVAEGVETHEELDCLRNLDCDELQGYYFSKPLPVNNIMEILRKYNFSTKLFEFINE